MKIKQINFRRIYYHVKNRYLTLNNVVVLVALIIAASWAWGSIGMMQRNYALEKELDNRERQQKLTELEVQTLAYQQRYYESDEYRDLAAREHLGLASPGEKALILPPNTPVAQDSLQGQTITATTPTVAPSNFEQWINFLFGGNSKDLQR